MKKATIEEHAILRRIPVPTGLDRSDGEAFYRQGVALAALLLMVNIILAALLGGLLIAGQLTGINLKAEQTVIVIMLVAVLLQTAAYYLFANVRIASMLIMLTYYFMCMGAVAISGAFDSPLIPILLCPVIVAYRFGSREDGTMNSMFVFLSGLGLAGFKEMHIPTINFLHGMSPPQLFLIGMIATLFTAVVCLATYTFDRND